MAIGFHQFIFIAFALATLAPVVPSGTALLLGLVIALTFGNPYLTFTRKWTPYLLQVAVVGLGASMNLAVVASTGAHGFGYTIVGILGTFLVGTILLKWIPLEKRTSLLISAGTAICGGSAIAAVSPVVRARENEIAVSLATVFFLNAVALFIFPPIGEWAGFSQTQFGLWAALAIHDTSSVVGASMQYGAEALQIATTVKLARALWIVPMVIVIGVYWAKWSARFEGATVAGKAKPKIPWFILGFVLMAALFTYVPAIQPAGEIIALVAKRLMVLTLFLIGAGLTRATMAAVGVRPFGYGLALWLIVGGGTFAAIWAGIIS